jgi:uncharacterized phiE125 gp8 family phage protein
MSLRPSEYLLRLVTAPAGLPVTVDQVKYDLRLDGTDDDVAIGEIISDAVDSISGPNGIIGRALMTQTWALSVRCPGGHGLNGSARDRIYIPLLPAASVSSISYFDGANVEQPLDVEDFMLYATDDWGYVQPKIGKAWPVTADRPDAITITYVAGYGDVDAIPGGIKRAIRLTTAHWFESPASASEKQMYVVPMGAKSLLEQYRNGWVG